MRMKKIFETKNTKKAKSQWLGKLKRFLSGS